MSSESKSNPGQSGAVSTPTERLAGKTAKSAGAEPIVRQIAKIGRFSIARDRERDPPDSIELAAQPPRTIVR